MCCLWLSGESGDGETKNTPPHAQIIMNILGRQLQSDLWLPFYKNSVWLNYDQLFLAYPSYYIILLYFLLPIIHKYQL